VGIEPISAKRVKEYKGSKSQNVGLIIHESAGYTLEFIVLEVSCSENRRGGRVGTIGWIVWRIEVMAGWKRRVL
jgi:hypothetical protein